MTAARVIDLKAERRKRAPTAQPVAKLNVAERTLELVAGGELRRSCVMVVTYLAKSTDAVTGQAVRYLNTIAEHTGYSRAEVGRAIKELVDAGLLIRTSRRRGGWCQATAFQLVDPVTRQRQHRRRDETTPSPGRDTYARTLETPSHVLNPSGGGVEPFPDDPSPAERPEVARQGERDAGPSPPSRSPQWEGLARALGYCSSDEAMPVPQEAYDKAKALFGRMTDRMSPLVVRERINAAAAMNITGSALRELLEPSDA